MTVITGRLVGTSGPTALPVPTVGQVVEDAVALRALVGSDALPAVTMRHWASSTGVGGGVFMWDATAGVDDGGTRFNAGGFGSSGAGWQRIWDGDVDTDMFGVGSTADDTVAVQSAIDTAAALGMRLRIRGTATVTSALTVPTDTTIYGYGATLDFSTAGHITGLTFTDGGGVYGLEMIGAYSGVYDDDGRAIYATGTMNGSGVAPTFITGPIVRDCTLTNWGGYGCYLAFCEKAEVTKNKISGIGYAGVAGLSCNDCVCDDNDISDVNGTGPPDAYGAFFDRSNGADEVQVPRSYRCSMSRNRVSNIHTAGNSQGLDTHGGVECLFVGNTIWDVDLGIAVVSSKLGASLALAPQRCVVSGNVIVGRNANTGIVLTGASDDAGATYNEMAEGNVIEGNVIADAGLADDVSDGAIRMYGTLNSVVGANTIVRPNVNGILLETENHGFQVTGNIIVDPHGDAESGVCVRLHANGQKGFVGGNTFRRENAALDTNVATHAIFATAGRLDCEVTIGPNAHVGATSATLKTTLNNVDGIATWQRGADDATPIGDAPYTLQVGLAARNQIINVSALTTNRAITLSTTNASRGDVFNVVRTVGDTGGPWLMDVGGLISLSRDEWCSVVFDGAAWGLAASGKLLKSGDGSPEGAVTGSVGDVYHQTDGGAGTTLWVKESGSATNTGWIAKRGELSGDGSPEGVVSASRGTLYVDTGTLAEAGEATLWIAQQASGNTGWVPANGDWEHREPVNTANSVAGWDAAGDPAVIPLPGFVTLPAFTGEYSDATLITTTTGADQVIATVPIPADFRGVFRLELSGVRTASADFKLWWSQIGVENPGGSAAAGVIGSVDIVAAGEAGTEVGAATVGVNFSAGNAVVVVTPANTNAVRWCAIVKLVGCIEPY